MSNDPLILVSNSGSSSLKLTVFAGDRVPLRAAVERTNQIVGERQFWIAGQGEQEILRGTLPTAGRSMLLQVVLDTLDKWLPGQRVAAFGHRVVHGGDRFTTPVLVTPEVLSELDSLVPLAPLHQPQLNHTANWAGNTLLDTAGSRVSILRVPADEEAVIGRHAANAITDGPVLSNFNPWKV